MHGWCLVLSLAAILLHERAHNSNVTMIYLVGLARSLVNRNPIFQLHQRKTCILLPAAIAAAVVDSNALDSMIGSGVSLKNIIDQRVVKLKNSIYA